MFFKSNNLNDMLLMCEPSCTYIDFLKHEYFNYDNVKPLKSNNPLG